MPQTLRLVGPVEIGITCIQGGHVHVHVQYKNTKGTIHNGLSIGYSFPAV